jgi:hypothetical protein
MLSVKCLPDTEKDGTNSIITCESLLARLEKHFLICNLKFHANNPFMYY